MSGSEAVAAARPVTIRRAESRDLPALIALLERYFVEGEVGHRDSHEVIQQQLLSPECSFVVAEIEDQLAGCILLHELKSIPKAAEAKRMYVAPEFRGHGIANLLLQAVEVQALASGYDWIYLDSKDSFAVAIAMYRRRGFEDCERYHGCAEATVFLRKGL